MKLDLRNALSAFAAVAVLASATTAFAVKIPEGTEVRIKFDDKVSSATNTTGDRFTISLDEPIKLADGETIPAGFKGVGEVTNAEHKGMMGKAGQLNVRFDYIKIGDQKVHLRGSQGEEGKGAVASTVVLTFLFGPLGLIKHGHDIVIQPGQVVTAYVDGDIDLPTPLAAPPTSN